MSRASVAVVAGLLVIGMALCARADVLVTTDGRSFEGKVISKDPSQVVFEAHRYGSVIRMSFKTDEISSITEGEIKPTNKPAATSGPTTKDASSGSAAKPAKLTVDLPPEPEAPPVVAYTGPTYYVIPLRGMVGKLLIAKNLEKSFADAAKRKPTVVVLDMNSGGGMINEVEPLVEAIRMAQKTMRVVVWVRKDAISAAAITSLACKEIYMHPTANIGAATAFAMVEGMPEDISEKMQSIWRARARTAAEVGGHNPLIALSMIDNGMELYIETVADKKVIKEGRLDPSRVDEKHKILSRRGRLLTMTATDAIDCGLAIAKAEDYAELGKAMGMADWKECKGLGEPLADQWDATIKKVESEIKRLRDAFRDSIRQAEENDPSQFTYTIYATSRQFTPESKRKWADRSTICSRFLTQAAQAAQAAADLAERFPQLHLDVEDIRDGQKTIASMRDRIARGIYKKGID